MYILGINVSHDSSVCLLKDGEVRVALALERISRVRRGLVTPKLFAAWMHRLIDYCLDCEGITLESVDYAVGSTTGARTDEEERSILQRIGLRGPKLLGLPHPGHHLAHASAAFFGSGFQSACAVVVDAYGSVTPVGREMETALHFNSSAVPEVVFRTIRRDERLAGTLSGDGRLVVPDELSGLGEIYRVITLILGFSQDGSIYDDAGKTMGLAAYGRRLSETPQLMRMQERGIDFSNALPFLRELNLVYTLHGVNYLSTRSRETPFSEFHKNLAAQLQWEFEEASLHLVRYALNATKEKSLVLSGGCFLNSVLNHRIARETDVEKLYIFPAATDDGNSYGAAAYAHHVLTRGTRSPRRRMLRKCGLGRSYDESCIETTLRDFGLEFTRHRDSLDAGQAAAGKLADGKIVGWFSGAGEFGPRALGHRSILANPAVDKIKDVLNKRVKFRESFRPYGASVLLERVHDCFEFAGHESPHMLLVCDVRNHYKDRLSGVTHIDGTCRIQTVGTEDDRAFRNLLEHFERLSGIPVLLNTSFNLQGMPIVETPEDAVRCFLATEMDYLYLESFAVRAPNFGSFIPVREDLTITTKALLSPQGRTLAEGELRSISVQVHGERGALSEVRLSSLESQLLFAIDGEKTVAQLLEEMSSKLQLADVLRLLRRGLISWKRADRGLSA